MDQAILVREINDRFRSLSSDLTQLSEDINLLTLVHLGSVDPLALYAIACNNGVDVFTKIIHNMIEIVQMIFVSPENPMTVEPKINGVPIVFAPAGPFVITAVPSAHLASSANIMNAGDQLDIRTTAGTNGNPLFAIVQYRILG